MADRGEGAGDQRHHLVDGDIAAHCGGRVRAIQQVCDMACEICRDARAAVRKSNSAAASALFTATFSAPEAIIWDSRSAGWLH